MEKNKKKCIFCQKTDQEVPLIAMSYREKQLYICPQHIPILIHEPQKLVGLIEDAENFQAG